MAAPTNEELGIIEKFRERLKDLELTEEQQSNMQLIRWLRAREYKLDQSEEMLRKSLKWREQNNMSDILNWEPPEMVTKVFPVDADGIDNANSPVVILPMGHYDLRGLIQAGYYKETIRHVDKILETATEKMKGRLTSEGVPVTQFTCIFDMDQLGMKTVGSFMVIRLIKEVIEHFEDHYPETFRQCFIINSSRIFQMLFAIVKPLLSRRTYEKIQILTIPSKWKPIILAEIPVNQLPECYGGTAWSNLHQLLGYGMKGDSLIELTIPAGEVFKVSQKISEEKCLLNWNITIEHYDIDFYVTFDGKEIVPKTRLQSPQVQADKV
ncbi:unnamed protein product [Allacma fusca]|uniref:CRAL-TRIO domain-containing protein n=1 Tax=Allacma fusca TaxID=39272 RepID=A0A8J2LGI1_9HEXA|nr:unnamed protein product [Allacma fusca]